MSRINRRAAKPALFETHGCDPVGNFAARFLSAAFVKKQGVFSLRPTKTCMPRATAFTHFLPIYLI
jgi:hypothetical protein